MSNDTPTSNLVDPFGRKISYLRISITDRCDFRCVYCMEEEAEFVPRSEVLSLEEIEVVGKAFVGLGVRKIRLTGGEPLVRSSVDHLCGRLSGLEGLSSLVMTTNGSQLERYAASLKQNGLKRINISLDSLREDRFRALTRTGRLSQVLAGIRAAKEQGFERIKLNAVIMRGRNEDEVHDLIEFAVDQDLDISFIEEMPLGEIHSYDRQESFISSDDLKQIIQERWRLNPLASSPTDGPARTFELASPIGQKMATRIGFISPHSHNFCGDCNRVRVTAEGRLLLCLGNEHSADLKAVLRAYPGDVSKLQETIIEAMALKPEKHHFDLSEEPQILRFMSATGG